MENRQLRNLLNQLADRIVALYINVEKYGARCTIQCSESQCGRQSAVARIHRLKALRVERGTWRSWSRYRDLRDWRADEFRTTTP